MQTRYALLLAAAMPTMAFGQITIFSDSFEGASTVNGALFAPTANSASYQSGAGAAGSSASIASGALSLAMPSSTGILGEVQARFSTSPVVLSSVGQYISLTITFLNTANILNVGNNANASLNIGLYDSGGVDPLQGSIIYNSPTFPTGGAQNWRGYIGRMFVSGNNNLLTRQPQGNTTSQNQELLFSGASGSQAFNSPNGTSLGSTTANVNLVNGSTYTLELTITLTGVNQVSVSNAVYNGTTTAGAPIFSQIKTGTGSSFSTNSFDGLAIGWRNTSGAAQVSSMDILDINVVSNIPEPTSSLLLLGGLGALWMARRKKA